MYSDRPLQALSHPAWLEILPRALLIEPAPADIATEPHLNPILWPQGPSKQVGEVFIFIWECGILYRIFM